MSDEVVDYERPGAFRERTSKLAVASMFVSLLSCPMVSGFLLKRFVDEHWISAAGARGGMLSLLVVTPVLATAALIRIRRSRGRLTGSDFAYFAFTFWALWIVFAAGLYYALRDAKFGPGD
jgi:hypothetical protein